MRSGSSGIHTPFQFYDSTIKSVTGYISAVTGKLFQFYDSTIKSADLADLANVSTISILR